MGYYTTYTLTSDATSDVENECVVWLSERSGYGEDGISGMDDIKWYDHEEHMLELSRVHPAIRFRLDGNGEENDDIWIKWFCDGLMAQWRLTYRFPQGLDPPAVLSADEAAQRETLENVEHTIFLAYVRETLPHLFEFEKHRPFRDILTYAYDHWGEDVAKYRIGVALGHRARDVEYEEANDIITSGEW